MNMPSVSPHAKPFPEGGIRLLILGGGPVVSECYLPAMRYLADAFRVTVVDASPGAICFISARYPEVRCEQANFRDVLRRDSLERDFDAVVVALPNHLHAEAAELALERGLSVLCEKPLAMAEAHCLKLVELASQKKRVLAVGMVWRLLPRMVIVRQAIRNGLIGRLRGIDIEDGAPYGWVSDSGAFFDRRNGGVLADIGVHYLDLAGEFSGKVQPIRYEDDARGGVEANCLFELASSSEVAVRLRLSRIHVLRNTIVISGEEGELVLEKSCFDSCLWRSKRNPGLTARLFAEEPFQGGAWPATLTSAFAEQLLEFKEVLVSGTAPRVDGGEAARTIGLIEWAYRQREQPKKLKDPSSRTKEERPGLPNGKVVVTGGTGFIGGHVLERLAELDFKEIVVPVRNYQTCAEAARFPIRMVRTDLLNDNQLGGLMQGARYVLHLAFGKDGPHSSRVTIEGTQKVVEAAIRAGVEAVVVLSTMYVFGHPEIDSLVDESYPHRPVGGEYGRSKAQMESWCLRRAESSGPTRIVVLNPTCVYGPRGTTYTRMPIQMLREGVFGWIEGGRGIANYVYVENLVDAILLAASSPNGHGQRFIINDGWCTWREFLMPLLGNAGKALKSYARDELLKRHSSQKTGTKDVLRHLMNDLEFLELINRMPVLGALKRMALRRLPDLHGRLLKARQVDVLSISPGEGAVKVPPLWIADLFGDTRAKFSSKKAERLMDWKPQVELAEAQRRTLSWLSSISS